MICKECFYSVNHKQDPYLTKCTICGTTMVDEPDDILLHGKYKIVKEIRPSQARLSNDINELMIRYKNALLLAEGGTGIGKSFAYLIPSILQDERIVISTAKKSLQRQLVTKDIPYLLQKMGVQRSFGLYKGTANYGCFKLADKIKKTYERNRFKAWAANSAVARKPLDKSNWPEKEPPWWDDISAENCMNKKNCIHADYCKPKPKELQILVVNHSILAIDLFLGSEPKFLLGPYATLILDEAHQAPEMFRSALSVTLTDNSIKTLSKYHEDEGIQKALNYFKKKDEDINFYKHMLNIETQYRKIRQLLNNTSNNYVRVKNAKVITSEIEQTFDSANIAYDQIASMYKKLEAAQDTKIVQTALGGVVELDRIRYVTNKAKRKLNRIVKILYRILSAPEINSEITLLPEAPKVDEELIVLADKSNLSVQPIEIGPYVGSVLETIPYKILVSATLKVDDSFQYTKQVFGIKPLTDQQKEQGHIHLSHPELNSYLSPFNYDKQARLYMPMYQEDGSIFPIPPSPSEGPEAREIWITAVTHEINRLILGAMGDTFVLCTSKSDLNDLSNRLDIATLTASGISIIKQEGDAAYAHDQYMNTPKSVLFGLKSFWEGIDIVGEKLRMVIFPKLPFPNPFDPIFAAQSERVTRRGESAFNKLSIPRMIFDLKQGVGRVIRSKTDIGVISILDPRIWSKEKDLAKRAKILKEICNAKTPKGKFPRGYGAQVINELRIRNRATTFEECIDFANSSLV